MPSRRLTLLLAGATTAVAGLALTGTVASTSVTAGLTTASTSATGIPSVGTAWSAPGPYTVQVDTAPEHTLYRPAALGANGEKHPVVIWGNGTGASPSAYDKLLRHWASHGFIVAAANTAQANNGTKMRAGIDLLTRRNTEAGSPYQGRVDLENIASAGHSQGGAGALNAAADARVDAVLPIQPGPLTDSDRMDEPALFLAGQKDWIVSPAMVKRLYNDAAHVPAIYAEVRGAGHFGPPAGGPFLGPTTAWLRHWLLADPKAGAAFFGPSCGYCSDTTLWSAWQRNAKATALQAPSP
ncbi:chlorophyllase/cutinase-like alpha/beta fold protein [Thermomonospora umbrina]|uniref:poly(ethylene terephthalate) hydrolase n=1 Tax=Thermomonospora umbrina TaxID=111806 RepID=A0A3D9SNA7_9ACTN|nr:acetylxylan esterase [Thermomonospora umbrina]REE97348.1 chlorophyllase-like protein [Thermomonospora umbrina]